jgi:hypothetical protein
MQLAFPELVASDAGDVDVVALHRTLDEHIDGIQALLARLGTPNPDAERAARLRELVRRHDGERILAFCQYAETAETLFRLLRSQPGVAVLTARGARVAGGVVSRRDVLRQFTPPPTEVAAADRIRLLIATDLLSEGLNLQEASVVAHLDLPWNPARLDQRLGRVRRLGSRHSRVTCYAFAPPAPADRLLRLEQRLRDKLRLAAETVGVAGRILPSPLGALPERGLAEDVGAVDARLRAWLGEPGDTLACAYANVDGLLAAVDDGTTVHLVADIGAGLDASAASVIAAMDSIGAPATDHVRLRACVARVEQWLRDHRAATTIDLRAAVTARLRRDALARVAHVLARVPRHRRAALAPLADAARAVATVQLGEGAERVLDMLVHAALPDEAWLRSIAAFGQLNARGVPERRQPRILGVIALIRAPHFSSPERGRE